MKKNLANWFITGRVFHHLYFWAGVSIPYLMWRDLSLSEAYSVIAVYTFFVVLLEYPTGVIGDYLGHKISVISGSLFWILGFTLMAFQLPVWGYYVAMILNAFGAALESGSDVAMLKANSNNFRKDLGNYKFYTAIAMFISIAVSGTLAKIWFPLPVFLSALSVLIGNIVFLVIPLKGIKNGNGNVFAVIKEGLVHIKSISVLPLMLLFSGVLRGYQGTLKNIGNSLGEVFDLDIAVVSAFIGFNLLFRAIGLKVSSKMGDKDERIFMLLLVILILVGQLTAHIPYAPLIVLAGISFVLAMLNFQMTIEVNRLVPDGIRASILSLMNLLNRLFGTVYMLMAGYVLELFSFGTLMILTAVIIGGASLIYFIVSQKLRVTPQDSLLA